MRRERVEERERREMCFEGLRGGGWVVVGWRVWRIVPNYCE